MSMLIIRKRRNDGKINFLNYLTSFIRHISTFMTSWRKKSCMRTTHYQNASLTKNWSNAYGFYGDWGKKLRKGAFRHHSSPNESIMKGSISKILDLKAMVTSKQNLMVGKRNRLIYPDYEGVISYALLFKLGKRVPSRPRKDLVGYITDHPVLGDKKPPSSVQQRWGKNISKFFLQPHIHKVWLRHNNRKLVQICWR